MKFQLKAEFAGRSTKCSACKNPLVVPSPPAAMATVAPAHVAGAASSLAQAGIAGAYVTLELKNKVTDQTADPCSVKQVLGRKAANGERYVIESEIARGGMGAVLRAVDCDIRREVALKFLLDQSNPGRTLRFIEEAQITGQLEHPNIVPVHELGTDGQKRVFFSMKMVRGRSLAQILEELRQPGSNAEREYTLSRLLNVLVSVCNALAYAHALGVIHRDLKPANIMVGDFGEVYVMDWGLAKVLKENEPAAEKVDAPLATLASDGTETAVGSTKVVTSRQGEAELTMEGTVMGTPVYMPPEQANGQVRAIDRRSDIYALGAILYEILTLQTPVDKDGGFKAVLFRVITGNIVPPAQRNPKRAKEGKIPLDLAAVAMKALAKDPDRRYQSMEALRRDIELFQEGRSVSAKEDTKREVFIKFVKRNQAFSAAVGAAAIIVSLTLTCMFVIMFRGWRAAEAANADIRASQKELKDRTKKAVPALVEAARLGVEKRRFENALTQTKLALDYDPEYPDALMLHGQLLIAVQKDFTGARKDFELFLKQRPKDEYARELHDLCGRAIPEDKGNLLVIAEVFSRQQAPMPLAERVLKMYGENTYEARQKLMEMYKKKIDAGWKDLGKRLTLDATGIYFLNLANCKQVAVLTPLEGMPLTRLNLNGCPDVRDLTPLKGMPLTSLDITGTNVRDLTPLAGLELKVLEMSNCGEVKDLTPLQEMPLTTLSLAGCKGIADLTPLANLKLTAIRLPPQQVMGMDSLRKMPSLTTINGVNAESFWQKRDNPKK
jgi:serine/threonine protein kinase